MNSLNLVGRLTKKPEMKGNVALFTIAVDKVIKTDNGYERGADFIPLKAFGKRAENLVKFTDKGSLISVEGKVSTGKYEKDGETKYTVDLIANDIKYLSKSGNSSTDNSSDEDIIPTDDGDMPF